MEPALRRKMERRLGHDFGDVRVHDGPRARVAAQALGAQAYTIGRRIAMAGPLAGASISGREESLVQHELIHVVQQSAPHLVPGDGEAAEREARHDAADRPGVGHTTRPDVGRPRQVACSVADWLRGTPHISGYSRFELEQEFAALEAWIAESSGGDASSVRVQEAHAAVAAELARRDEGAGEPAPRLPPSPDPVPGAVIPASATDAEVASPGVLGTIGGALMGEFEEDPTIGMIALDTGVSLIPVVDQLADARDVVAHLYWMIERGQHAQVMRWVGLVLSLIGAIPEIGTAIKGLSKTIIKGGREVMTHLDEILGITRRLLPDGGTLRRLLDFVRDHWARWSAVGTRMWGSVLDRVHGFLNSFWGRAAPGRVRLLGAIADLRRLSVAQLPRSFNQLFVMVEAGMLRLMHAVGLDPAMLQHALGSDLATAGGRVEMHAALATDGTRAVSGGVNMSALPLGKSTPHRPGGAPRSTRYQLSDESRAGSLVPEIAAGFERKHVRPLGVILGHPFDTPALRRFEKLWLDATNLPELAILAAGNSRRFFDNQRRRFWRAVASDPVAFKLVEDAGLVFRRAGSAPVYRLSGGGTVRVTIDHILERHGNPGRALDPTNLQLSFTRENTVLLRLINALDPFQGARVERRVSRVEASDIERGIDDLSAMWVDVP